MCEQKVSTRSDDSRRSTLQQSSLGCRVTAPVRLTLGKAEMLMCFTETDSPTDLRRPSNQSSDAQSAEDHFKNDMGSRCVYWPASSVSAEQPQSAVSFLRDSMTLCQCTYQPEMSVHRCLKVPWVSSPAFHMRPLRCRPVPPALHSASHEHSQTLKSGSARCTLVCPLTPDDWNFCVEYEARSCSARVRVRSFQAGCVWGHSSLYLWFPFACSEMLESKAAFLGKGAIPAISNNPFGVLPYNYGNMQKLFPMSGTLMSSREGTSRWGRGLDFIA